MSSHPLPSLSKELHFELFQFRLWLGLQCVGCLLLILKQPPRSPSYSLDWGNALLSPAFVLFPIGFQIPLRIVISLLIMFLLKIFLKAMPRFFLPFLYLFIYLYYLSILFFSKLEFQFHEGRSVLQAMLYSPSLEIFLASVNVLSIYIEKQT